MDFIAVVRSALKVSGAVSKASPLSFMQFLFAALAGISGGAATFSFSGLNEEGGYHSAPNPPPLPLAPFDAYTSHLTVYGVSVPALALAVREAIAPEELQGVLASHEVWFVTPFANDSRHLRGCDIGCTSRENSTAVGNTQPAESTDIRCLLRDERPSYYSLLAQSSCTDAGLPVGFVHCDVPTELTEAQIFEKAAENCPSEPFPFSWACFPAIRASMAARHKQFRRHFRMEYFLDPDAAVAPYRVANLTGLLVPESVAFLCDPCEVVTNSADSANRLNHSLREFDVFLSANRHFTPMPPSPLPPPPPAPPSAPPPHTWTVQWRVSGAGADSNASVQVQASRDNAFLEVLTPEPDASLDFLAEIRSTLRITSSQPINAQSMAAYLCNEELTDIPDHSSLNCDPSSIQCNEYQNRMHPCCCTKYLACATLATPCRMQYGILKNNAGITSHTLQYEGIVNRYKVDRDQSGFYYRGTQLCTGFENVDEYTIECNASNLVAASNYTDIPTAPAGILTDILDETQIINSQTYRNQNGDVDISFTPIVRNSAAGALRVADGVGTTLRPETVRRVGDFGINVQGNNTSRDNGGYSANTLLVNYAQGGGGGEAHIWVNGSFFLMLCAEERLQFVSTQITQTQSNYLDEKFFHCRRDHSVALRNVRFRAMP